MNLDYENIIARFSIKQNKVDSCQAICPAHNDKEASLTITHDEAGGKTLIRCHAGCKNEDILQKVNLKMSDLFDKPLQDIKEDKSRNGYKETAVYRYCSESGELLFEKVRFSNNKSAKNFTQRRYLDGTIVLGLSSGVYYETFPGSNTWSKKKKDSVSSKQFPKCEPVLYNLPEILKAIKKGEEVYFAEGEKDCDNLVKWGLTTTTNFDGASKDNQKPKWRKEYNHYFKGAKVIILHDNDGVGKAHAQNIADNLIGIAEYVKCPELTDVEEKEDISDWIQKGHTKEELLKLVTDTPKLEASDEKEEKEEGVFEQENCYCKWIKSKETGDFRLIEISNFIIEPIEKVQSSNSNVLKAVIKCKSGRTYERSFDIRNDLMSGYSAFKKSLNELLIFSGRDFELEQIKALILRKEFPTKMGFECSGFHYVNNEWIFVSGKGAINEKLEVLEDIVLLKSNEILDTSLLNYEPIAKEELENLSDKLFKFNELGKSATILGSVAAMFLKEKLFQEDIKFHHLLTIGEAGSGKSQTTEHVIIPLLGMNLCILASDKVTKFSLERISSSSNFLPCILDEFKPFHMTNSKVDIISDFLRNVYGCITVLKGKSDLSLNEYVLNSPVILIGEDFINETAITERSLKLAFSKLDSLETSRSDAFKFLKANSELLKKLARALLNEALKFDSKSLKNIHDKYEKAILKEISTDRVRNSIANCLCGITLLNRVYKSLNLDITITGHKEKEIITAIVKTAYVDLLDENNNTKSAVDQIIETFDTMADAKLLARDYDYKIIDGYRLILHLKRIFYHIENEERIKLELSQREFSRQVKKQPYCINSQASVRLNTDKRGVASTKIETCLELDINKMIEKGLDITTFYIRKIEKESNGIVNLPKQM